MTSGNSGPNLSNLRLLHSWISGYAACPEISKGWVAFGHVGRVATCSTCCFIQELATGWRGLPNPKTPKVATKATQVTGQQTSLNVKRVVVVAVMVVCVWLAIVVVDVLLCCGVAWQTFGVTPRAGRHMDHPWAKICWAVAPSQGVNHCLCWLPAGRGAIA